jgi:sugar lactone lactonase YvrE
MDVVITALPTPACGLGESPFWHPDEAALYWVDIPGCAVHRWVPASSAHAMWPLPTEPGCIAPLPGGTLLLAARDGLWRFDPSSGERTAIDTTLPYDPATERYNDGKCDPQGRLWVGTVFEPRTHPAAALYRYARGERTRMAGDAVVSNGLAFSPDGRTMYWSDTSRHRVLAFDFDGGAGTITNQRVFAQFPLKPADGDLSGYGGRPDGAAVDIEGCYWSAMFEGQRLLRFAPDGRLLREIKLPVRCATMPCFGGADLKTLFITTARHNRPADELAAQPLAGHVLTLRVDVPGLPVNFAAGV